MPRSLTFAAGPLRGELTVPGDKSISHRAAIVAACARQPIHIANLNPGRDVAATLGALAALGVASATNGGGTVIKPARLRAPAGGLDCGNSGSTARMLAGACAGAGVQARFDGDESLRRRPMEPVAAQLRAFGARIHTAAGHLPMELLERRQIETCHFILLAPSAQVKSALLFAGLFAGAPVTIDGDRGSRDHTERLLRFLGADVEWDARRVRFRPAALYAERLDVPGDFSAAAFFITAAAIAPGSRVALRGVGVNPTRTGLLDALRSMGARIDVRNQRTTCGEPVADIVVEHAPLHALSVGPDLALRAIDEIVLLAVAAACADGTSTFAGIAALRAKESDRAEGIVHLLGAVGINAEIERSGLHVVGGRPAGRGTIVRSHGDHRMVMAAAVAACVAGSLAVDDATSTDVSFPQFEQTLARLQV